MPTNYEQSARQRLMDNVLAAAWHDGIESVGVVFGGPEPSTRYDKNTAVRFTTYQNARYRGTFFAFNNREPITEPFGFAPQLTAPVVLTTVELLPYIEATFGVVIDPEDIIDEPVSGTVYRIVSSPNSLGWQGVLVFNDIVVLTPPPGFLFLRTADNQLVKTASGLYVLVTQP